MYLLKPLNRQYLEIPQNPHTPQNHKIPKILRTLRTLKTLKTLKTAFKQYTRTLHNSDCITLTFYCAQHGREVCRNWGARASRFLEANVKSLIFTIGAPQIYNLRLLCPPRVLRHLPPMVHKFKCAQFLKEILNILVEMIVKVKIYFTFIANNTLLNPSNAKSWVQPCIWKSVYDLCVLFVLELPLSV